MTKLYLYSQSDGTSNGATLECYTLSGDRYLRIHLKPQSVLSPNCPSIYYEYPNNDNTFVDYLATNHLLPPLDADGIIEAYNHWDAYATESLVQHKLPVNDYFAFLDIITKVTTHNLKVSRTGLSPLDIMASNQ